MRLFVVVIFLLTSTLHAQSMHSPDALLQGEILSDQYENAVALRFDVEGYSNPSTASAVMINNRYGLTAAHLFIQNGFTLYNHRIHIGANYNQPDRVVQVESYGVYPGWTGQISGQKIDLAWFKIAEPLDVPTLEIAPASVGDVITYVGYGRPATPALGLMPFDGERRAFETRVDGFGVSGTGAFYIGSLFRPSAHHMSLPLGGGVTGGCSGSGSINSSGQLTSIAALEAGSPNYGMASYGIHLSYGDIPQWITDNTTLPPNNEPCYRRPGMPSVLAICKASIRPKLSTSAVPCRFPDC